MKENEGKAIIKKHVAVSVGLALIPVPGVDIVGVTATQIKMIEGLAKLFDLEFNESSAKAIIAALTGGVTAKVASSLIKIIPGIGSLVGGVSMAAFSGASTYATGQVFLKHFLAGGSIDNFDPYAAKESYKKHFEEGKTVVSEMEKEKKTPNHSEDDIFQKLEKLADLKARKLITEEDFETQKKRLLDKL